MRRPSTITSSEGLVCCAEGRASAACIHRSNLRRWARRAVYISGSRVQHRCSSQHNVQDPGAKSLSAARHHCQPHAPHLSAPASLTRAARSTPRYSFSVASPRCTKPVVYTCKAGISGRQTHMWRWWGTAAVLRWYGLLCKPPRSRAAARRACRAPTAFVTPKEPARSAPLPRCRSRPGSSCPPPRYRAGAAWSPAPGGGERCGRGQPV